VMRLGVEAEVLKPVALRREVVGRIEGMAEMYRGGGG
jgi:hypothetical protein